MSIHKKLIIASVILFVSFFSSCVTDPDADPERGDNRRGGQSLEEIYRSPEDADEALAFLEKNAPQTVEEKVVYGVLLFLESRLDESSAVFTEILEEDAENLDALYNLALIADEKQDSVRRDAFLDTVLAHDPNHISANWYRGHVLLRERKYSAGKPYLLKALNGDPQHPEALMDLARIYMRQEREEDAEILLGKAIEFYPEDPYFYVERSRVRVVLRKYGPAEDDLTKAIELQPEVEWHYLDRARIRLTHFQELENAREDLETARELNPGNLFVNYYLAEILDDMGEFEQSYELFSWVIDERNDFYYAYRPYAKQSFMMGDYQTALEYFLRLYSMDDEDPVYVLLAYGCMVKLGRRTDGQKLLTETAAGLNRDSVIYEMFRYYLGSSSLQITQSRISRETDEILRSRMTFYVGLKDFIDGNDAAANTIFQTLAGRKGAFEFEMADWYNG